MTPKYDLVGHKFGYLTVIEFDGYFPGSSKAMWKCRCECGNVKTYYGYNLKNGNTGSCGHDRVHLMTQSVRKHGKSRTLPYHVYYGMINRCHCKTSSAYKNYGARGIEVCERWRGPNGFENFMNDMGVRPTMLHTVDRIDNDGNYEPTNCKWATMREQSRNTRRNFIVNFQGENLCLSELCERLRLPYTTMWFRLKTGWGVEKAINTPIRGRA